MWKGFKNEKKAYLISGVNKMVLDMVVLLYKRRSKDISTVQRTAAKEDKKRFHMTFVGI